MVPIPARQYAGIVGIVILALGVVGVIAKLINPSDYLIGILNISWVENIIHLVTGGLMVYVGFGQTDTGLAKTVVGVLGIVYLLVGIVSIFSSTVFGLISGGYTWLDDVVHLLLGIAGIAVAYLPGNTTQMRV